MRVLFGVYPWIIGIIAIIFLFLIIVLFLISYSDLDVDLTPTDLARRLQPLVVPEYAIQGSLFGMFLLGRYWVEALLNLPLVCWNVYCYATRKHKIDPTRIYYTRDATNKVYIAKLLFYIVSFFVYVFRLVYFCIYRNTMDYKEDIAFWG